jgi:hypothetical protein
MHEKRWCRCVRDRRGGGVLRGDPARPGPWLCRRPAQAASDTGARSIGHHDTAGWNGRRTGLPASSRFGQLPSEPVTYTRVKPRVVVELDVDTAIEHYRWRHACRFVRLRAELHPLDLLTQSSDTCSEADEDL